MKKIIDEANAAAQKMTLHEDADAKYAAFCKRWVVIDATSKEWIGKLDKMVEVFVGIVDRLIDLLTLLVGELVRESRTVLCSIQCRLGRVDEGLHRVARLNALLHLALDTGVRVVQDGEEDVDQDEEHEDDVR